MRKGNNGKKQKYSGKQRVLVFTATLLSLGGLLYYGNTAIQVSHYEILDPKIPSEFDGFKIIQVSDLHNTLFGEQQQTLMKKIAAENPDIIVVTGDLLDFYTPDVAVAEQFIAAAVQLAPVYYINGNHESRLPIEYNNLKVSMREHGVVILENSQTQLVANGQTINLLGVNDPAFDRTPLSSEQLMKRQLTALNDNSATYTILLSHRPELFETYVASGINLVFSGHAHGGQVRIPFIGGVLAPHQGLFPKYTAGVFVEESTTMVVSRGLGNSAFPLRVNNRPELVVVTLRSK